MQALKLLLLLGIIASAMFALHTNAFAQTVRNDTSTDSTDSAATEDANTDTASDGVLDKRMGGTMPDTKETYKSPLQQLMAGTDPHQIQCGAGLKLVFKATNFHPACVKETTSQILLNRGWVSSHVPSSEEITDMISKLPKLDTKKDDVKMDEKMNMDEKAAGNNTNTKPTNHKIDLSESMEMGAQ